MSQPEHATPWQISEDPAFDHKDFHIVSVPRAAVTAICEDEADAEFIIRAVNAHEALVEALEWALPIIEAQGRKERLDPDEQSGTDGIARAMSAALKLARD